mmetsp:Transcript_11256/g.20914  ORF Transcript_11256/g.20914 Transcript_11256/m.20914 type:complete len:209 (-) Transcript_11256:75-701(-)
MRPFTSNSTPSPFSLTRCVQRTPPDILLLEGTARCAKCPFSAFISLYTWVPTGLGCVPNACAIVAKLATFPLGICSKTYRKRLLNGVNLHDESPALHAPLLKCLLISKMDYAQHIRDLRITTKRKRLFQHAYSNTLLLILVLWKLNFFQNPKKLKIPATKLHQFEGYHLCMLDPLWFFIPSRVDFFFTRTTVQNLQKMRKWEEFYRYL